MAVKEPQPAAVHALLQDQAISSSIQQTLPGLNTSLLEHIKSLDFSFVISDAQHPDMPIVFASDGFYSTTGYSPTEVIGRNCRFMQGPDTERQKVMEIRDAIREDRCCQVCLLNYRKNGSTFINQFFLSPIKSEAGVVTHYVGIQTDVTAAEAGLLNTPEKMSEQQAAVALGTAAGCSVCDMVMQQQEVQKQLQQHGKQQQQTQEGQERQLADQQQQQEGVCGVIQEEVTCAGHIRDAFQHNGGAGPHQPCGAITLPSSLLQSLLKVQASFVLSDPRLTDCPIVHASPEFLQMSGYSREEVEGRNCRFLQGPGTDPAEVAKVREALSDRPPRPVTVTLLNYRKDGTPFWNALHVAPVRDAEGDLEYFIGVQLDVTQQGEQQQGQAAAAAAAAAREEAAAGGEECVAAGPCKLHLRHKMAHMTATGAVRVACRGLSGSHGGLRRSIDDQGLPQRGYRHSISNKRSCDGAGGPCSSGSFNRAAAEAVAEVGPESEAAEADGAAGQQ